MSVEKAEYSTVETKDSKDESVELVQAKKVEKGEAVLPSFQVVAPCDLCAGFCFVVEHEGILFRVSVPRGRVVHQGEMFTPTVLEAIDGSSSYFPQAGAWSDGVCECCNDESCVWACFCGPCVVPHLLGAVSQRLDGNAGSTKGWHVWTLMYLLSIVFLFAIIFMDPTGYQNSPGYTLYHVCAFTLGFVLICGGWVVRARFRGQMAIPGNGCQDCLCAWFCNCCNILQMWRHVKTVQPQGETIMGKMSSEFIVRPGDASIV